MSKILAIAFLLFLCACNEEGTTKESLTDTSKPKPVQLIHPDSVNIQPPFIINQSDKVIRLTPRKIHLAKGKDFTLNIPEGFEISIAAEGLNRLRFLAKSPDGRLFATDMHDKSDNKKGKLLLFDNWNENTKKFDSITQYLEALHNPNQVVFYNNYLYVAETGTLSRYAYDSSERRPSSPPEIIATFPDYGLGYKYGGWHLTRSIAFNNDKLYISIGSSCNACIETEDLRATIMEMNPDGSDKRIFARGLRNSVGMKWVSNRLWVTAMGRDLIGPDKPEDLFLSVEKDGFYGWPFYYQYKDRVFDDLQFKDSARASWIMKPSVAFAGFKAHSAPLGFEYMNDFADDNLKNCFLVCLHGSTSAWRQRGNAIVKVIGGTRYIDVVSGFLTGKTDKDRHGRPCDILMQDSNSFFFTDDLNGVLYYLWKTSSHK